MNINWNALPARQFYLVLGGGLLLISAAIASAVVLPQYKRLRSAQAVFATAAPLADNTAVLAGQLEDRDARIVALSTTLHGDRARLPAREMEAFVIDRLQTNAWRHNVALHSVTPRAGETIENFQELIFELTLTGHYHDLYRWLRQLHADLGFVVIKELRLSPSARELVDPVLEAQVTLASYRREEG
jgi:type II secretory pathway component PulM